MKRMTASEKEIFTKEISLFKPNLEIEQEILRCTNKDQMSGHFEKYSDWLKNSGQTYLARLIQLNSKEYPTDSHTVEVLLGDYLADLNSSLKILHGFVHSVTLLETKSAEFYLKILFARPIARLIREIRLNEVMNFENGESQITSVLTNFEGIKNIQSLALEASCEDDSWSQKAPLGDLQVLLSKMSSLEYLYLKSSSSPHKDEDDPYFNCETKIGVLNLPLLKKYTRRSSDLSVTELKELSESSLNSLEELVLIGGEESGLTSTDFDIFFNSKIFQKINSIGLCRFKKSEEILNVLIGKPFFKNVKILALNGGDLSDSSIEFFEKNKASFLSITKLDFSENLFSEDGLVMLENIFKKARFSGQRSEYSEYYYQDALYQEAYSLENEREKEEDNF